MYTCAFIIGESIEIVPTISVPGKLLRENSCKYDFIALSYYHIFNSLIMTFNSEKNINYMKLDNRSLAMEFNF